MPELARAKLSAVRDDDAAAYAALVREVLGNA
jgi:hypothetical protein